jgi:hypothetical protein
MKANLLITNDDVINPDHDKRCKYGPNAIAYLPRGTVLANVNDSYLLVIDGDTQKSITGIFARLALARAEQHTPKTSRELSLQHGLQGAWVAYEALDLLVQSGKLSLDDVSKAIDSIVALANQE